MLHKLLMPERPIAVADALQELLLQTPAGAAVWQQHCQEQGRIGAGAPAAAADVCCCTCLQEQLSGSSAAKSSVEAELVRLQQLLTFARAGERQQVQAQAAMTAEQRALQQQLEVRVISASVSLPQKPPKIVNPLEARSASAAAEGEKRAMNSLVDQKGLRAVRCR